MKSFQYSNRTLLYLLYFYIDQIKSRTLEFSDSAAIKGYVLGSFKRAQNKEVVTGRTEKIQFPVTLTSNVPPAEKQHKNCHLTTTLTLRLLCIRYQ